MNPSSLAHLSVATKTPITDTFAKRTAEIEQSRAYQLVD